MTEKDKRLARLVRAAAPGMPADLKLALKREARARASRRRPSFLELLRASLGAAPWTYGAGAAFAAAALVLAVRLAVGPRPDPAASAALNAPPPSREAAAQLERLSADLWTDDDGSDRDD